MRSSSSVEASLEIPDEGWEKEILNMFNKFPPEIQQTIVDAMVSMSGLEPKIADAVATDLVRLYDQFRREIEGKKGTYRSITYTRIADKLNQAKKPKVKAHAA